VQSTTAEDIREPDQVSLSRVTFGVLGPIEAMYGTDPVALGGSKQRGLLATLVLRGNEVVPLPQLVDDLWGVDPPPTAHKMVQVFLSRLRAAIVAAGGNAQIIETHPHGYSLRITDDQVDLRRAERLATAGKKARASNPEQASQFFTDALTLWRGSPLSGMESLPFADTAIPRIEEFRLALIGDRLDAELQAGRHAELIGELRELTAEHPSREQPHAQLMLALYRSGRQVDALAVFRAYRDRLHDEMALDPSPALKRLEHQILNHDATLSNLPADPALDAVSPRPAGPQTPRRTTGRGSRRNRLRGTIIAAFAAALVGVATYAIVKSGSRQGLITRSVPIASNSLAVISAATYAVRIDVPVGADPGPVAVGAGSAWIGNRDDDTVTRLSLRSYAVQKTYGLGQPPVSVSVAAGHVWIGLGFAGTLSRILVRYDQLSAPFAPVIGQSGLLAVAANRNSLWIGLADNRLLDLNPANLQPRISVHVPGHVRAITTARNAVWTISDDDENARRINSANGHVVQTVGLHGRPMQDALADGSVWVTTQTPNRLWRIDATTGHITSSLPLLATPTALAVGGQDVWVSQQNGTLEHLGTASGSLPTTIDVGRVIGGLAVSGKNVLVAVDSK
jgi:DNA-binding SARP family transcriptional activator/streptogramin lyase